MFGGFLPPFSFLGNYAAYYAAVPPFFVSYAGYYPAINPSYYADCQSVFFFRQLSGMACRRPPFFVRPLPPFPFLRQLRGILSRHRFFVLRRLPVGVFLSLIVRHAMPFLPDFPVPCHYSCLKRPIYA